MIARIALLLAVSAACFGPSQEKQKARRWTDDTGRYSIEAEFVRHQFSVKFYADSERRLCRHMPLGRPSSDFRQENPVHQRKPSIRLRNATS